MVEAQSVASVVVNWQDAIQFLCFWAMSGIVTLMIFAAMDLYFHEFAMATRGCGDDPSSIFACIILGPISLIIPAILIFIVAPIYAFRKWMKWESVEVAFDPRFIDEKGNMIVDPVTGEQKEQTV